MRRWLAAGLSATARLSAVEVASALARRCREGAFAAAERDRALVALEDDLSALRAGEAIQLASALLLRRELSEAVAFAAYDDRLKAAAKAEGLAVVA